MIVMMIAMTPSLKASSLPFCTPACSSRILPRGSVHAEDAREADVPARRAHLDLVGAGLDRVAPLRDVVVREVLRGHEPKGHLALLARGEPHALEAAERF